MSDATDGPTVEQRADLVVARAYELAASPLEGINEAAEELGALVGDDRRVIERARRVVAERLAGERTRADLQVASLIRRAIELGDWRWQWHDTAPPP